MKVVIHANGIEWQRRYTRHAVAGLKRHGIRATITNSPTQQKCDLSILMGPNAWQRIEKTNQPYLMFNRKFVGNAPQVVHENCAISWNGFNGYGTFCVNEIDPTRLGKYLTEEEILPWKGEGLNTIYCEQSNVGRSTTFSNLQRYYHHVKENARGGVVFRNKPVGENNISHTGVVSSLLEHSPKVVANLNSTISLDALVAGIPVVSLDRGDPAFAITGHTLDENPVKSPNRLEFFQYLAHCQWHETEIQSGEFWDNVYPIQGNQLHEWTST